LKPVALFLKVAAVAVAGTGFASLAFVG